jgi:hypothetical protein
LQLIQALSLGTSYIILGIEAFRTSLVFKFRLVIYLQDTAASPPILIASFPLSAQIRVGLEIYVNQIYGLFCRIYNGKDNRNELLLLF